MAQRRKKTETSVYGEKKGEQKTGKFSIVAV